MPPYADIAYPASLSASHPIDKPSLRRELRRRRRGLTPRQQRDASRRLCQRLKQLPEIRRARRISLYLPVGGEIDPTPLIGWLRRRNVRVYLPVLRPFAENHLWLVEYRPNTPMIKNRFGIFEPAPRYSAQRRNRLPAWGLDVMIVPLVGFDAQGNRMGMGGGFYDRTLAFTRRRRPRPWLIGVAHSCQQVPHLPPEPWDISLQAIVSDQEVVRP
ncbi:5-formyltetrahydrofolate cyclo-ligase [Halomonas sp. ZH2S]|uniref:5-formyltetrahydrofolate cyclo-ligase n=1 Tax=Vreelandella zhuhanensis TaxID=2684210 RepID=A0A7X3H2U0_9GAMM|nr:5-formyltetrahydrofolate cyclo-ligase [Halomonas zhuhanensis]MWJ29169.1 5-formyltetrahydrofolate cyclo-ligase [Halomonas zhuhanensis]